MKTLYGSNEALLYLKNSTIKKPKNMKNREIEGFMKSLVICLQNLNANRVRTNHLVCKPFHYKGIWHRIVKYCLLNTSQSCFRFQFEVCSDKRSGEGEYPPKRKKIVVEKWCYFQGCIKRQTFSKIG